MKDRSMDTGFKADDRRRSVRATLVGSALVVRRGKNERVVTAVLDNANRIGAGLHAKESLEVNEPVTVSFAFLDQKKEEKQEKLSGNVAWVKPWEKGHLIGVVWEQIVTKEKNPWLYSYLDETLKQTA
jgi:PilZ domain